MEEPKAWNKSQLYKQNKCSCEHCSSHSTICAKCQDYTQPINWRYSNSNPPNITCTQCPKSYHLDCLPFQKRAPNSWAICKEIGPTYTCEKYLEHFTLSHKIKIPKYATKYESLIHQKYNEMDTNIPLKITAHFCGFIHNKWKYFIQDCIEIQLEKKQIEIARIIDIFTDNNKKSWLLIQWYWNKDDFLHNNKNSSNDELLFANNLSDDSCRIIKIEKIFLNRKVKIFDTFKEYKSEKDKPLQLKRNIKMEEIELVQKYNKITFDKLCLAQYVSSYKTITFDKAFYSNMSCNGNINDKRTYKTDKEDTNKMRMAIQNKIYSENRNYTMLKHENKQNYKKSIYKTDKIDTNMKMKLKSENTNYIMPKHENKQNYNLKKRKSHHLNSNNNNTNNKHKKRKINNINNNSNTIHNKIIKPKQKRKLYVNDTKIKINAKHNNNKIITSEEKRKLYVNNNKNKNNNEIIGVSVEKYNKLKKENEKLKMNIDKYKVYKNQALLLQKSNASYKRKIDNYETNGKILKVEIMNLNDERNKLNSDWKRQIMISKEKHNKINNNYKNKIKILENRINTIEKTINKKNNEIDFFRRAREGIKSNINIMGGNHAVIPYHVSSIHSDTKDTNTQHGIIQQDMTPNEMRQMFPRPPLT